MRALASLVLLGLDAAMLQRFGIANRGDKIGRMWREDGRGGNLGLRNLEKRDANDGEKFSPLPPRPASVRPHRVFRFTSTQVPPSFHGCQGQPGPAAKFAFSMSGVVQSAPLHVSLVDVGWRHGVLRAQ